MEFGLLTQGMRRFDLRDPYRLAVSISWPAFVAVMLACWLTLNLGFALLYVLSPGAISTARPGSFSDAFFFSVETLATVGYGVMAPATLYGHVVSAAEVVIGMAFTAILTGLLFVRFSRARANILFAKDAIVGTRDGHPALMLRLASGQRMPLSNVQARLFLALTERNADGTAGRHLHDLPLQQSSLAVLLMLWTLAHVIDETSPLHGLDADALIRADARLFLTVRARDHALAAQVYAIKDYPVSRIRFGMRFATAVALDEAGRTVFDVARLSLLEPGDATSVGG
jgi:inward rectifier potassium channel